MISLRGGSNASISFVVYSISMESLVCTYSGAKRVQSTCCMIMIVDHFVRWYAMHRERGEKGGVGRGRGTAYSSYVTVRMRGQVTKTTQGGGSNVKA